MNKYHVIISALFAALISKEKNRDKALLATACDAAGTVKKLSGEITDIEAKSTRTKEDNQAKREAVAMRSLLIGSLNQVIPQLSEGQAKDVSQRLGGSFAKLALLSNGSYTIRYNAK
tara:strand:- start:552 stop:902 length:351 start_codon:yes stop_codon:yes gene_type:complete